MRFSRRPISVTLSLIATFAALNTIADIVPVSPIIGLNSFLTLGWVFSPLAGLMLGPLAGSVSCLIATLVQLFLGRPVLSFGPAGLFRSSFAACETGLLASGRWMLGSLILGALILGWLALPTGREAALVLTYHLLGLALIITLRRRLKLGSVSSSSRVAGIAVMVDSYCGNIVRHLYGNLLLVLIVGLPAEVFVVAMPLTFLEQAFFSFTAFIFGAALFRLGLRQTTFIG